MTRGQGGAAAKAANGQRRQGNTNGLDTIRQQAIDAGRTRLLVTGAMFGLVFLVIGARLADVTVIKQGNEPRLVQAKPSASWQTGRADIVDRNGVLLATSLETSSLYANPRHVLDRREAATKLAEALPELSAAEIFRNLASNRSFVWLRRHLTPRQKYAVNRLGIPGFYFQREERRVYPLGHLVPHLLGYTDTDNKGIAGIEQSFDQVLRATPEPLGLAIDIRAQYILRRELRAAVSRFRAIGGSGVVMDVRTGEILAMVSLPDFDPNKPASQPPAATFNRATLGVYEMGSTVKILTVAMALDSGTVTLKGGFDASKPIRTNRFLITDYKPKGRWLSVPEIFMYSSNIGAAKMALAIGTNVQRRYLGNFGLLRQPSIEIPEVGSPIVPSPWREINTMTIGFGHGLAVSPVQLTAAVAAVVNGGILWPATVIRRLAGHKVSGRRVISARTSEQMRRLMRLVVARGTGRKAAARGYLVGGKTGTAEKSGGRGYRRKALLSSFIAAFPMTAPRYVVLALLDEPRGRKDTLGYATGGWVAAPLVGRVIARLGPLFGVPPVDESSPRIKRRMSIKINSRRRKLASF